MLKLSAVYLLVIVAFAHGATIYVGPTRTYKDPAAAYRAGFNSGDTMIIDDGTYQVTFGVRAGLSGWTIKSASGNPYACRLDGRRGVGSGYPLTAGKGTLYVQSPGTIQGIGFINGGGGDGAADGEAGVYAERFNSLGELRIINCAFDANENGIFVPSYLNAGPGQFVQIYLEGCIFSRLQGNGVDGYAHNYYINGLKLTSVGCTHMPSYLGNNVKTRSGTIIINDLYNRHDQGRSVDVPSGGRLSLSGGVYTAVGDSAVSNFFSYAGEDKNSGVYPITANGLKIYCGRNNDYIWNNGGTTWTFTNTQQFWRAAGYTLRLSSNVVGLSATGSTYASVPAPIYPAWFSG